MPTQDTPDDQPVSPLSSSSGFNRRSFIQLAGASLAAAALPRTLAAAAPGEENKVSLPPLHATGSEANPPPPKPSAPREDRVGIALVGLGHLTIEELLPAFGQCKYAKPVALVSGDRAKAQKLARQYNVREQSIYDYSHFDEIAQNPEVQVVYIVLPNGMHAEYTVRAAKAGKHVLCEKPMANTAAECQQMIDACRAAKVKLMVAYRSQYEPMDRAIVKAVRANKLGELREFISVNSQNEGDPKQWRLNKALAGGGPLPDVGIYCLNAARFLSGQEPVEVSGQIVQPANDPRFREVESAVQFTLRFASGFTATCSSSYNSHRSQMLRLNGSEGWAEMSPAYAYRGLRLRMGHKLEDKAAVIEPQIPEKNQFALEMDHMAQCVLQDRSPHTPGEEGLQDMRIIEAIYNSARTGKTVTLQVPSSTRGPEPEEEKS